MSEPCGRIPFVEYDVDGRIDQDAPCFQCGYNLRTLHDDGECPECGASVYESARLAWLCQHDPAWLRRVAAATIWIEVAMFCFAPLPLLVLWGLFVKRASIDAILVCVAMLVVGAVAGLLGFWLGGSPCPESRIRQLRVRRVARVAMTAGLAGFLLFAASRSLFRMLGIPWWLIRPLVIFALACLTVGAWAVLTYASVLAAHVPNSLRARTQSRIAAWGFALYY